MRILAFVAGLCISAVGAVGILAPSAGVWLAQQFVVAGAVGFYVIATVRIAFGLTLVSVAHASRAPRALRALGYVIVALGVMAALMGLFGVEPGRDAIERWTQQPSAVLRLTAVVILGLGGAVAWACAPAPRAA